MIKPKNEVLIEDKGRIILARVLLVFDAPLKKYPNFGIYSYFLNAGDDLIIFDTGPKFNTLLGFSRKETANTEIITGALDKFFPGKPVREILLSHYHFDHSENAPSLQQTLKKRQRKTPPIRLHKCDLEDKKYLKFFNNSIDKIYENAGYESWEFGKPVEDNEKIENTDFIISHSPGHTSGNIALVSYKYKVTIGGWWLTRIKNPVVNYIQTFMIDEDKKSYPYTLKKLIIKGHQNYTYHPQLRYAFYTV